MKKLELNEIRRIQIEMLSWFDLYCENNKLIYSMCGGTLLGAVRHKGYIPWDDDIDVMMPREDYNKFLREFRGNERYKLLNPFENNKLPYPYAKLINVNTILIEKPETQNIRSCIYIDIFPIDGLPDELEEFKRLFKKMKKRNLFFCILRLSNYNKNYGTIIHRILWRVVNYLNAIVDSTKMLRKTTETMEKYKFSTAKYVGNITCSGYGERERMERCIFDKIIMLPFENKQFKAIVGYDLYLRNMYGEYMKLPPVEKRKLSHDYIAYMKDVE